MSEPQPPAPPPRAFTQGVGTVFQFVGVMLFLAMMFICCGSSLLSKETATQTNLNRIGWHLSGDAPDQPFYSAQQAVTFSVTLGVLQGMALAGLGLGLQAESRWAPAGATAVTSLSVIFWLVQTVFAAQAMHSVLMTLAAFGLLAGSAVLLALSIAAVREMRLHPTPPGYSLLPAGYKVPYSHMHQEPPEVRLAAELEQRRQRLAVQQKELEMLEAKLKHKFDQ